MMKLRICRKHVNNKGFSLVELIIVIAIMAILVGVVGTQVVPYIEKSRRGKDYQVFSAWNTAGMSAYSLIADKLDASEEYVIVILDTSVGCEDTSLKGADDLADVYCELTGLTRSGTDMILSRMASSPGKAVKAVKVVLPAGDSAGGRILTTMYEDVEATSISAVFDVIENN